MILGKFFNSLPIFACLDVLLVGGMLVEIQILVRRVQLEGCRCVGRHFRGRRDGLLDDLLVDLVLLDFLRALVFDVLHLLRNGLLRWGRTVVVAIAGGSCGLASVDRTGR